MTFILLSESGFRTYAMEALGSVRDYYVEQTPGGGHTE